MYMYINIYIIVKKNKYIYIYVLYTANPLCEVVYYMNHTTNL